jgi:hypothetical protein
MAEGFPDVELALCELLADIATTVTATDAEIVPPVIQVNRTGGGADRLGLQDAAIVEVQCFGGDRPASTVLNNAVRTALSGARAVTTSVGFIDRIVESTAPIPIPYPDQDLRRVISTWTVTSRLQQLPA